MFGYFLRTLPRNIVMSFAGKKFLFLVTAVASTYVIVQTGFDWQYLRAVQDPELNRMFFPALVIGAFLPVSLALYLIVAGALGHATRITIVGWALGQAVLIGSLVTSALKVFTGRIQPDIHNLLVDSSHGFQFGLWQNGIFWGWPSSHTAIAFAMAFTLITLFPKNKHVLFYSVIYALYIGIGVSLAAHWFSEFVAGACVGIAIGLTVGASFRQHIRSKW